MASYLFDLLIRAGCIFPEEDGREREPRQAGSHHSCRSHSWRSGRLPYEQPDFEDDGVGRVRNGFAVAFSVIGAFIGIFVTWAIVTGIFYVISLVFNGNGSSSGVLG